MGKITDALKKATEVRLERLDKIGRIKEREQMVIKKIGNSNVDPRIVTYFDPKAVITEQYKILRTNLLSMNKGKSPRIIVVTSSVHSEGKTVTTLNLAMAIAQSAQKLKVLLIDADLRRGRMAKYLGVNQKIGLTEVLKGEADVADVMFNIDVENLTFIASGTVPENPAELLDSEIMKNLLTTMRTKFDYVLIDPPPIVSVTDSGIVGSEVDGVLLVIQAGRTQRGIVKRATELLNQSHSKLLGHVLTNIE
ncbi:MAG: hypothetical protein A2787_09755, partial [Omnitrophica WOR_2 bacterium RIFCSPHIGHO2_01_FULL_48_9]